MPFPSRSFTIDADAFTDIVNICECVDMNVTRCHLNALIETLHNWYDCGEYTFTPILLPKHLSHDIEMLCELYYDEHRTTWWDQITTDEEWITECLPMAFFMWRWKNLLPKQPMWQEPLIVDIPKNCTQLETPYFDWVEYSRKTLRQPASDIYYHLAEGITYHHFFPHLASYIANGLDRICDTCGVNDSDGMMAREREWRWRCSSCFRHYHDIHFPDTTPVVVTSCFPHQVWDDDECQPLLETRGYHICDLADEYWQSIGTHKTRAMNLRDQKLAKDMIRMWLEQKGYVGFFEQD